VSVATLSCFEADRERRNGGGVERADQLASDLADAKLRIQIADHVRAE
jgi:hypothetical protein